MHEGGIFNGANALGLDDPPIPPDPVVGRVSCGEGESYDAATGKCIPFVPPAPTKPASSIEVSITKALPYMAGAAVLGIVLVLITRKMD